MNIFKIGALACATGLMAGAASADVKHIVLFELTDDSQEAVDALVAGCWEHLSGIEGITAFEVGAPQAHREGGAVMTDYDVVLMVTLATEEDHAVYDTHPDHMAFIGAFRENWASVRVIDADLSSAAE